MAASAVRELEGRCFLPPATVPLNFKLWKGRVLPLTPAPWIPCAGLPGQGSKEFDSRTCLVLVFSLAGALVDKAIVESPSSVYLRQSLRGCLLPSGTSRPGSRLWELLTLPDPLSQSLLKASEYEILPHCLLGRTCRALGGGAGQTSALTCPLSQGCTIWDKPGGSPELLASAVSNGHIARFPVLTASHQVMAPLSSKSAEPAHFWSFAFHLLKSWPSFPRLGFKASSLVTSFLTLLYVMCHFS